MLSLLRHQRGDHQASLEYSNQALHILGDNKKHHMRMYGLIYKGHALTSLGDLDEAKEVYQQAIQVYYMHLPRQVLEAMAGLARISMACGDTKLALEQVEEILTSMEANTPPIGSSHPLDGTLEPFHIYLTCCQVLKANHDPRAPSILTDAYNLLQTRATNISDEHLRDCFLNNVAVNREIVEEYEGFLMDGTTSS